MGTGRGVQEGGGHMYIAVQLLNCVRLFCDPIDCGLPGSSVHGIFQARILESVAISFSRGSSEIDKSTIIVGDFNTLRNEQIKHAENQ